ncbi:hypothetical protein GCM10020220_114000 [Nonomuraea rubra]
MINLAFDLPKFITREPPPCIWFHQEQEDQHDDDDRQEAHQEAEQDVLLGDLGGEALRLAGVDLSLELVGQLAAVTGDPARLDQLGRRVTRLDRDRVDQRRLDPVVLVDNLGVADVSGPNLLKNQGRVGRLVIPAPAPELGDEEEQHDDAQDPQQWPTCKSLEIHPMRNPLRARPFLTMAWNPGHARGRGIRHRDF